jgi:hypothetical protein
MFVMDLAYRIRAAARNIRPLIAVVAIYAVIVHLALTPLAVGHPVTKDNLQSSVFSVICHSGSGQADENNDSNSTPDRQAPCPLCTLAKSPFALLTDDSGVSIIARTALPSALYFKQAEIIRRPSPTGQYQRGPPATIPFVG